MNNSTERKPEIQLPLSVRFAKEYLKMLCGMLKKYTNEEIQESNELTIIHRSLWTSLIIEVGRIFDTYDGKNKEVISYKKLGYLKDKIDKLHGEAIIGKIIRTRKTFTAHWSKERTNPVLVSEICSSNLIKILEELDKLSIEKSSAK